MARLLLHRSERESLPVRLLTMSVLVGLFGLFSAMLVGWLLVESHSMMPMGQPMFSEWGPESLTTQLGVGLGLIFIPAVASMTIGVHTLQNGGFLGFLVSLFNLIPFFARQTLSHVDLDHFGRSPLIWSALVAGSLIAFYLGDFGSYLCRRRLLQEAVEEEVENLLEG